MNDMNDNENSSAIETQENAVPNTDAGYSDEANARAFDALLAAIENAASVGGALHGGVYQRSKGTRFETLTRIYFQNEPTYKDLFSKVQTYAEWAQERPGVSAGDTGIDLVASLADETGFAAIQCKFYSKDARVAKSGVDSFIAAANKDVFKMRFIVATNETWTDNVKQELARQKDQIIVITRGDLARSKIDWSTYLKSGENEVKMQEPRRLRPYQKEAVEGVIKGLAAADRGKLVMACGTGKTFTSMKIAEQLAPNGFVMFLVPSLPLLSQTLSDWKQNMPLHAYAVCSDSSTGVKDPTEEDSLLSVSELNYPATTNARPLAENVKKALARGDRMTVIFSTYQSLDVVHQAQELYSLPEFNLVICDEAHRTAGGYLVDHRPLDPDDDQPNTPPPPDQETDFTRVHNAAYIRAKKRLYMTATPKIYGEAAKSKGRTGEAVLYSMDDESVFGKTLYEISFRRAVSLDCLCDYKVIVLTVPETIGREITSEEAVQKGEISASNAVKIIGAWRALSKSGLKADISLGDDTQAMKRAVGFAQYIEPRAGDEKRVSSKQFAACFQSVIDDFENYRKSYLVSNQGSYNDTLFAQECRLVCDTQHIDGSMDATEKDARLSWLREEPEENHCKILFNVRCLSEGVDVPSLDAIIFFTPRKSQVDVVQTVGRVMRKAPHKRRGYVIIPVVLPADGLDPSLTMEKNDAFRPVWQVLKALKSIDPDLGVDGQLGKISSDHIEVLCLTDDIKKRRRRGGGSGGSSAGGRSGGKSAGGAGGEEGTQMDILFGHDEILMEHIKALIVKKVGNVREWEDWAEDVGTLCKVQIEHLKHIVGDPACEKERAAFNSFMNELHATINEQMSEGEALEMLGQHLVTQPVMDALFPAGEYHFMEQNPIGKALTTMVRAIDRREFDRANLMLKDFYDSVQRKARTVTTLAERQIVVRELFDKFFKFAFPKMRDKLGIVYTPEPVVDFIIHSVADVLKKEFGASIANPNIHVLDPFTGTGTFMLRLLQSGLIPPERLKDKFERELHANEIVPLAYYIASMNLEMAYHDLMGERDPEYRPNTVMVWTDTFADNDAAPLFTTELGENNRRLAALNAQDIRVIISNPPYSVGQESANDDNANEHYEKLDARIAETYAARTNATLKNSLYDSYIRAYRWASDRIGDKGVIGFVTNAGWLDSNSADGMRKCMAEEFSSIYVYHLKGNQRTSGERSRQEGGKVFGEGSRAPVAIVILVKNPDSAERGRIYFHAVADYLSREEKLKEIAAAKSVANVQFDEITPDSHGDWLNQRDDSFARFMRMDSKKTEERAIFAVNSNGAKTNRDAWVINASSKAIMNTLRSFVSNYNNALEMADSGKTLPEIRSEIGAKISWTDGLLKRFQKQKVLNLSDNNITRLVYRPFINQNVYYETEGDFVERPGKWGDLFPAHLSKNLVICVSGIGAKDFTCLMTNQIPCFDFLEKTQAFPLYLYSKRAAFDATGDEYECRDAITNEALAHFRSVYGEQGASISKEDLFYYIYGVLHSPDYRARYANNLGKELPRIPRAATFDQFKAFSAAGRRLADLHVNFERQPEWPAQIRLGEGVIGDDLYTISKIRYAKIPGKKGAAAWDKTTVIYNDHITIEGVPPEAQEYVVNKRSALDWILEKAEYKVDKDSGIVNDFNRYGLEMTPPNARYPLELLLKVITVSVETVKIVRSLPPLEIHQADR